MSAEENPSNGELSEYTDLQEAYNKLCKVDAKDAMSVELGLKKIAPLELDKKNLLVNLFDATKLLNNVKTENMLLLEKVKNLEHELSVAREQTDRSASSKLDHMLNVQKSPSDKWLRFCRKHLCVCTPFHKLYSFFFFRTPCK